MDIISDNKIRKLESMLLALDSDQQIINLKNRNKAFLNSVSPAEIAWSIQAIVAALKDHDLAEERLVRLIQCIDFPREAFRQTLPENHRVRKLLLEHDEIRRMVEDLDQIRLQIRDMNFITGVCKPYHCLQQIAGRFYASDKHVDAEEELFYRPLEAMGFWALPKILKTQHFELRHHTVQLHELVLTACTKEFGDFRAKLEEIASRLIPLKRRHIRIEETVFYPLLVERIEDPSIWEEFTRRCEEIDTRYL